MDTYGNPEFEELLKDKENESCFDCSNLNFTPDLLN